VGRELSQNMIDESEMLGCDPDDLEDYFDMECGLGRDGLCSQAGTEHCDFECPNRNSDMFAGSQAWKQKHARKARG